MKKVLIIIISILVVIQFITIDKTNPVVDSSKDFITLTNPPQEIGMMIKSSCYDCHSHHTKYPWYTNVAPVSWIIKNHIDVGRSHLNFSAWSEYDSRKQNHQLEECIEVVENSEMPLIPYTLAHSEANLSDEQRKILVNWFTLIQN